MYVTVLLFTEVEMSDISRLSSQFPGNLKYMFFHALTFSASTLTSTLLLKLKCLVDQYTILSYFLYPLETKLFCRSIHNINLLFIPPGNQAVLWVYNNHFFCPSVQLSLSATFPKRINLYC